MGRPAEPPHKPIKDSTCLGDGGSQKARGAAAHEECASSLSHKVESPFSGEGRSRKRMQKGAAGSRAPSGPPEPPAPHRFGSGKPQRPRFGRLAPMRGPAGLCPLALTAGCELRAPMQNRTWRHPSCDCSSEAHGSPASQAHSRNGRSCVIAHGWVYFHALDLSSRPCYTQLQKKDPSPLGLALSGTQHMLPGDGGFSA